MDRAPIRVFIDGEEHRIPPGTSVLQALRQRGLELPTLCHDDRLAPVGQCWSCVVEIAAAEGQEFRNRAACHEPLRDGSRIRTTSPARAVNRLTGPARDRITGAPEYKVTAARVAAVAPQPQDTRRPST